MRMGAGSMMPDAEGDCLPVAALLPESSAPHVRGLDVAIPRGSQLPLPAYGARVHPDPREVSRVGFGIDARGLVVSEDHLFMPSNNPMISDKTHTINST